MGNQGRPQDSNGIFFSGLELLGKVIRTILMVYFQRETALLHTRKLFF